MSNHNSDQQSGKLSITISLGDARAEFSALPRGRSPISEQFHFQTNTGDGLGTKVVFEFQHEGFG